VQHWFSTRYAHSQYSVRETGGARCLAEAILASDGHQVDIPCEDLRGLVQDIDMFIVEIDDVEQFLRKHARKIS
jgi:hypothetical protein